MNIRDTYTSNIHEKLNGYLECARFLFKEKLWAVFYNFLINYRISIIKLKQSSMDIIWTMEKAYKSAVS